MIGAVPDVLGRRLLLGVLVPSTNTVVEPEYHGMVPDGVTVHTARMYVSDPDTGSDAAFWRLMEQMRAALATAVRDLLTARPQRLCMGMTAVAFVGGSAGDRALAAEMERMAAGTPVTTGPEAMTAALRRLGATRVGLVSPYQPGAEEHVRRYFSDTGVEVVRMESLRSSTATSIAEVEPEEVSRLVAAVDGPGVEAIVQVGTNLPMVALAEQLERRQGKPVLAINTATLWRALRASGIDDRVEGFGTLLRDH
jgi:maleate isomerase